MTAGKCLDVVAELYIAGLDLDEPEEDSGHTSGRGFEVETDFGVKDQCSDGDEDTVEGVA